MPLLASALYLVACQPPAGSSDEVFTRLGVDADLAATVAGWRPPAPRLAALVVPALGEQLRDAPQRAAQRGEAFVRQALAEIRPEPLLYAALAGLRGERGALAKDGRARLDAAAFEDGLERAHREIVRALGTGREPGVVAPALQAAVDSVLRPGAIDAMTAGERAALRDVCDRAAKVDIVALEAQARAIVHAALAFADSGAEALARAPTTAGTRGVSGAVVLDHATPFGRLVIGGTGTNEYQCDQLAVIVDLGGDDVYLGPVAGAGVARCLSVVVDIAGDDRYRAHNDGCGAATFGVALLLDLAGDDSYRGEARCCGFGAAGIGALFDLAGNDELVLAGDGGGAGFAGIGLYLDAGAGEDHARVGPRTLGCGLPGGFGMFVDDGGDDERGPREGEAPGHTTCGAGCGVHGWLAGGVGLFVDVGGTDRYTLGDLAAGAGAEGGSGVCFDAAGDDTYTAGAFALGSGRTHGCGVFVDAGGDDGYRAAGPSLGSACGWAIGRAEDRAGCDVYELAGAWPAAAEAGGLGAFLDFAGKDRYRIEVRPLVWPDLAAAKTIALSLHEDRGGEEDLYDSVETGIARRNDATERQRAAGLAGEVVRVFSDR